MKGRSFTFSKIFLWAGGCLLPSLFFCQWSSADTMFLRNGDQMKGLIVEQHADRVVLSTENGEVPVLLARVKNIEYDEPERNFLEVGRNYETAGKWGEALAYYEKAIEFNPKFDEAKKASAGVKNRFWSVTEKAVRSEIDKMQMIYGKENRLSVPDADEDEAQDRLRLAQLETLENEWGVRLTEEADWIVCSQASASKKAALSGLQKGDRLVSMDGESLRYLNADAVAQKFLDSTRSHFTLEVERDFNLPFSEADPGMKLNLEYQGVVIKKLKEDSPATAAGLKEKDLLFRVGDVSTRYMPLSDVSKLVKGSAKKGPLILKVRRFLLLSKK